jgi:excisionase family DNA binding protein
MIDSSLLNFYSIGKYVTTRNVSEATGYNPQYLRRLLRAGKITGIKIGQVWLIEFDSLQAYLKLKNNSFDKRCGPEILRSKHCVAEYESKG